MDLDDGDGVPGVLVILSAGASCVLAFFAMSPDLARFNGKVLQVAPKGFHTGCGYYHEAFRW